MLPKLNSIFVFILLFFISSCEYRNTRVIHYAPDEGNSLQLHHKGDLKSSLGVGLPIEENRLFYYNPKIGYSPKKNLGVFASFFHYKNFDSTNPANNSINQLLKLVDTVFFHQKHLRLKEGIKNIKQRMEN